MSLLYITEHGGMVGFEGNRITIRTKEHLRSLPVETIDSITMMGASQLTTNCMEQCMKRGIPVSFMSKGGSYFGRLVSTGNINAKLQRRQSALYETEFALELSKRIIEAKIHNQMVVLRRYARSNDSKDVSTLISQIKICKHKIEDGTLTSDGQLIGYEGNAARLYFDGLSKVIDPDFAFHGRSRRPPKDEFNSLISLGYSILMNEIYNILEAHGVNPYFGFLHKDDEHHPTLCSDLMEEWRPVIVDTIAMSLINGHEITKEDFQQGLDMPGCYLTKEGLKFFLSKLEDRLNTKTKYFPDTDQNLSFRSGMEHQVMALIRAISSGDASDYHPLKIR